MNEALKNSEKISNTVAREVLRRPALRVLEDHSELSQRRLAAELRMSMGGVNFAPKARGVRSAAARDRVPGE